MNTDLAGYIPPPDDGALPRVLPPWLSLSELLALARIFHDASDSEAPRVDGMGKRVRFLCLRAWDTLTTRD